MLTDGTLARLGRNEGVRRMQTAERAAVVGSPDLESLRQHHTLETTPAVAAGLEEKPWSLERVVEMTKAYWLWKRL